MVVVTNVHFISSNLLCWIMSAMGIQYALCIGVFDVFELCF
jgi:hypothetical protein